MKQCTANSRQTGERCKLPPTPGRNVCRFHGGKTLQGLASPTIKNGKYSKYLPARLLAIYEESTDDPRLLDLSNDISLVDARLADLLKRVDTGESGEAWQLAREAQKALNEGLTKGDMALARMALSDLEGIIKRGMSDYMAWREIGTLLDRRERLVRSQRKSEIEAGELIPKAEVRLLTSYLLRAVTENVKDPATLDRISASFRSIAMVDGRLTSLE